MEVKWNSIMSFQSQSLIIEFIIFGSLEDSSELYSCLTLIRYSKPAIMIYILSGYVGFPNGVRV